jgi:hypothetical protein
LPFGSFMLPICIGGNMLPTSKNERDRVLPVEQARPADTKNY